MISLICPHCEVAINAEERYAGRDVKCPKCAKLFTAPVIVERRKSTEGFPVTSESALADKFRRPQHDEVEIVAARRSNWSVTLMVFGIGCIAVGLIGAAKLKSDYPALGLRETLLLAFAGIAAGVQYFLLAFLVDVLTDIRWFLQERHRRDNGHN